MIINKNNNINNNDNDDDDDDNNNNHTRVAELVCGQSGLWPHWFVAELTGIHKTHHTMMAFIKHQQRQILQGHLAQSHSILQDGSSQDNHIFCLQDFIKAYVHLPTIEAYYLEILFRFHDTLKKFSLLLN